MQESSALTLASVGVNFRNNFPVCVYMTACNDDKGDNFRLFPFSVMRFLFNAEVFSPKINFTSHFLSCFKTKAEKMSSRSRKYAMCLFHRHFSSDLMLQ